MRTYILDIIPSLQRFSQKLDDLTILTNQHWVVVDEIDNSKIVYIFRANSDLLISQNGRVEKAKWEYLGNNSLLIDKKDESYLFKHGFLDENILALKVDSKNEYAFLVNENKYEGELNSIEKIDNFLTKKYLLPNIAGKQLDEIYRIKNLYNTTWLDTDKGKLEIRTKLESGYTYGDFVFLNDKIAPDGKYATGWPAWLSYVMVKNGKLENI
ncbi:MAG: hypothetical protein KDC85_06540 [Saprospiraceae bacterium]|nr:hypothetical protein [Saprospiraceae bacterium]MCB9326287.1 hypothetical protein [Lewinellaceae bacterium]